MKIGYAKMSPQQCRIFAEALNDAAQYFESTTPESRKK